MNTVWHPCIAPNHLQLLVILVVGLVAQSVSACNGGGGKSGADDSAQAATKAPAEDPNASKDGDTTVDENCSSKFLYDLIQAVSNPKAVPM